MSFNSFSANDLQLQQEVAASIQGGSNQSLVPPTVTSYPTPTATEWTDRTEWSPSQLRSRSTQATSQWSSALETVLDQPPSSLPLKLICGGVSFVLAFGTWAWLSHINEIGRATGRLVPKGEAHKIHPVELGKVTQLAVKEGQVVKAGQLLMGLDDQLANTEIERLKQLIPNYQLELSQKQAQLENVRLGAEARAAIAQANSQAQLSAISQAHTNTTTLQQMLPQYQAAVRDNQERLARMRPLVEEGALPKERLYEIEQALRDRQAAVIKGQGELTQSLAELERLHAGLAEKQAEGRQQQLEVQEQIKLLEIQITELQAKLLEAQNLLSTAMTKQQQRFLYAPVNGIISALNVHNPGEVVQPGQVVAELQAAGAPLVLQASLPTHDAGFIKPGMAVQVKFDAYPYQDYGSIPGKVITISPDAKSDEVLGRVYQIEIALDRNYILANHQKIPVKPGQTAVAEIITRQRRIADILLDPIRQLQKSDLSL